MWLIEFEIPLNMIIIISGILFVVKIWILRYPLDRYIAQLGNVLNKPGVNIGEINGVVFGLWRELLNIDIFVDLQNIEEQ